jgi:glycosyltransferase involved in cell wall biosynthesis
MILRGAETITAIIPVWMGGRLPGHYLEECLRSVVNQSRPADEIIVVDDASPHSVEEFLRQFDFFDRLKMVRLPKNLGVSGARNAGLQAASGEWIAYLDHDDAWIPTKLETQIAYLRAHPECDGVDSCMDATYPDGRRLLWGTGRRSLCLENALKENQIFNQMLLVRRMALLAAGGFDGDVKVWDDQAISIRLAAAGFRIDHLDVALGLHRRHHDNASGNTGAMIQDGLSMLWKYRALYNELFVWRCYPARTAFILETAGRKRGKIVGRALRMASSAMRPFGSYELRTRTTTPPFYTGAQMGNPS